jgi:hypothetical protein
MTYNSQFEKRKATISIVSPNIQRISYFSNNSEYMSDSSLSIYENDSDYNFNYSREYDYDTKRITYMFNRDSLYTVPGYNRTSIDLNNPYYDEDKENEDINPIVDLYMQSYIDESYIDESSIEPIMQLPLSSNQYMLMKQKWNEQLDIELAKSKSVPKMVSWSGFSLDSNEFPSVPRNSNASKYSEQSNKSNQSKKSTRSWKSFFNKFYKKNNKNKKNIPFYENLIK